MLLNKGVVVDTVTVGYHLDSFVSGSFGVEEIVEATGNEGYQGFVGYGMPTQLALIHL